MKKPFQFENYKIFPRNLTARADHLVIGNPVNTRPETGIENCFPGLEFDQRNLDKAFIPGLVFEFHREVMTLQPILREIRTDLQDFGIKQSDIPVLNDPDTDQFFLWLVQSGPHYFDFTTLNDERSSGLDFWRGIRDLEPGSLKILIARLSATKGEAGFREITDYFNNNSTTFLQRDEDGKLLWAVLCGNRNEILDDEGVVLTEVYQPGDLTRSLCNPWQYDFHDCRCYYWASNKPDMVSSSDGNKPYLNFLRKDRNSDHADKDITDYKQWVGSGIQITHVDLINNWEMLPVILNDKEVNYFREELKKQLRFLATIEHAVAIEYLYAYYTLNIKIDAVKAAALELLRIAIDEMRHLRWVNEMLHIASDHPQLDRAEEYGDAFENRKFQLTSLTKEQLEWFIQIEKPSKSLDVLGQIDGMYTRMYEAIKNNHSQYPEPARLETLIRLIIDEGDEHYNRFLAIKEALKPYLESGGHLLTSKEKPFTKEEEQWLLISDLAYEVLLVALHVAFSLSTDSDGTMVQTAVRNMQVMDKFNRKMAENGLFPNFTKPSANLWQKVDLIKLLEDLIARLIAAIGQLKDMETVKKTTEKASAISLIKETDTAKSLSESAMKSEIRVDAIDMLQSQVNTLQNFKIIIEQKKH